MRDIIEPTTGQVTGVISDVVDPLTGEVIGSDDIDRLIDAYKRLRNKNSEIHAARLNIARRLAALAPERDGCKSSRVHGGAPERQDLTTG
jgi:hypothetical protein